MEKPISIFIAIALCTIILAAAQPLESQGDDNNSSQYAGAIDDLNNMKQLIVVKTTEGLKEFYYKNDGKKDCLPWYELKMGDKISISYTNTMGRMEATCVKKISPDKIPYGEIQGALIH
jgi:hypothetical protein